MPTSEQLQNCSSHTGVECATITITSLALKKGKPVVKALNAYRAQLTSDGSNSYRIYTTDQTNRDFQRWRFPLEPGCIIDDETGSYEVISVSNHMKSPKKPFFYTKQIT